MDILKALKIAASAVDQPTGHPAAKPPPVLMLPWSAGWRSRHALRAPLAADWRGLRRSPDSALKVSAMSDIMIR